ncbi:MAG TPA: tetratricopeptide repeat protein, partial [Planctomycetota bacterium]|nr:tetratricopeptide repeat protein [Planctomycetota bacterium]
MSRHRVRPAVDFPRAARRGASRRPTGGARLVVAATAWLFAATGCGGDYEAEGRELYEAADWRGAADNLEIAYDSDPSRAEAGYLLAIARSRLRERERARELFEEIAAKHPEWRERALARFALSFAEQDRFDEALAAVDQALARAPRSAPLLEARGAIHLMRARHELARFQKRMELKVRLAASKWVPEQMWEYRALDDAEFRKRGEQLVLRLEREEAFSDGDALLEWFAPVREAVAAMERDFKAASDLSAASTTAELELGTLARDRGDVEAARKYLGRVLELKPEDLGDLEAKASAAA